MDYSRWLQINHALKLNHNDRCVQRGEEGCDPEQKFDLIFKTITHNYNDITKDASVDIAWDETCWSHGVHRLSVDGLMKR